MSRREPTDEELQEAAEEALLRVGQRLGLVANSTPFIELEPDHDWRTFGEMMDIFECAPSEDIWRIVTTWSPSPIPGVRWHCDSCRWHEITMSFVQRPTHCGSPMKPEMTEWLIDAMDQRVASLRVALLVDKE